MPSSVQDVSLIEAGDAFRLRQVEVVTWVGLKSLLGGRGEEGVMTGMRIQAVADARGPSMPR